MRYIFAVFFGLVTISGNVMAENQTITQLQQLIEQQQEELRQLRGQIEELTHKLKKAEHQNMLNSYDQPAQNAVKTPKPEMGNSLLAGQPTNSSGSRIPSDGNSTYEYNQARTLLDQRQFAEAEVALTQFIKKYPKDPMLVNAYYWLAETYYIRSDYKQAALKFGDAYQAYLDHKNSAHKEQAISKGPEIIFKLASSLFNIGKFDDAKVTLEELKEEFPKLPGNINQQAEVLRREIARKVNAAS